MARTKQEDLYEGALLPKPRHFVWGKQDLTQAINLLQNLADHGILTKNTFRKVLDDIFTYDTTNQKRKQKT